MTMYVIDMRPQKMTTRRSVFGRLSLGATAKLRTLAGGESADRRALPGEPAAPRGRAEAAGAEPGDPGACHAAAGGCGSRG